MPLSSQKTGCQCILLADATPTEGKGPVRAQCAVRVLPTAVRERVDGRPRVSHRAMSTYLVCGPTTEHRNGGIAAVDLWHLHCSRSRHVRYLHHIHFDTLFLQEYAGIVSSTHRHSLTRISLHSRLSFNRLELRSPCSTPAASTGSRTECIKNTRITLPNTTSRLLRPPRPAQ